MGWEGEWWEAWEDGTGMIGDALRPREGEGVA